MLTVGIDTVEIARFNEWTNYSRERLSKIFSEDEITYCLEEPAKSAERMAVRFAAKEAFYKAVTTLLREPQPFMYVGSLCKVIKQNNGNPGLEVDWQALGIAKYNVQISLTHTSELATAIVIITKEPTINSQQDPN